MASKKKVKIDNRKKEQEDLRRLEKEIKALGAEKKAAINLSNRKLIFILLTFIGIAITIYFLISKNWFLVAIGILFSFVAAYNITCGDKK